MNDVFSLDDRWFGVRSAETKHIDVGDRFGPLARAKDVAHHSADAGIGSSVGFDGAGMVVGLDLQADGPLLVEADEAGVVVEATQHKPRLFGHDAFAGFPDKRLEQRMNRLVPLRSGVIDRCREYPVLAVLAPGLGDDLHFDIGRLAVPLPVNPLHHLHVLARQREFHRIAQGLEFFTGQVADQNVTVAVHTICARKNGAAALRK